MNTQSDTFDLYLELKETNRILKTLATIEILKERYSKGLIEDDKYKELLDILTNGLMKSDA